MAKNSTMQIGVVAVCVLGGFILFSIITFFIFRRQSRGSEHPDALRENASEPTPLNHAPDGAQSEYSASLLSLGVQKNPGSASNLELDQMKDEGKKFKRRLFFEDTEDDRDNLARRGSQAV